MSSQSKTKRSSSVHRAALALLLTCGVSAVLSVAHAEDTFPIIKKMAVSSSK